MVLLIEGVIQEGERGVGLKNNQFSFGYSEVEIIGVCLSGDVLQVLGYMVLGFCGERYQGQLIQRGWLKQESKKSIWSGKSFGGGGE